MGCISAAYVLWEGYQLLLTAVEWIPPQKLATDVFALITWRLVLKSPCFRAPSTCSQHAEPCKLFACFVVSVCSLCKKQGRVKFTSRVKVCLSKFGCRLAISSPVVSSFFYSWILIWVWCWPTFIFHYNLPINVLVYITWMVWAVWLVKSSTILK